MRRFSLPFALAVVLASAVALAAPDKIVQEFQPLGASTVIGEVRLNPMPQQESTKLQAKLSNLEPGVEYVAIVFSTSDCLTGTPTVVAHFTAKQNGSGNFNEDVNLLADAIVAGSISIARADDQTVSLACTQ